MLRRILPVWILGVALAIGASMAAEPVSDEMKSIIAQPIQLSRTANAKRHVVFNHASHQKAECVYCHHKELDGKAMISCANTGCHDVMDRQDKSAHSYYQAIHKRESTKSCLGCHREQAKNDPDLQEKFRGCTPCHVQAKS